LKYLKLCTRSVVIDHLRARAAVRYAAAVAPAAHEWSAPDLDFDPEAARALWEIVGRQLRSEPERVLAHLTFVDGLKSAQIQACRPDLFLTVRDVYRVTKNVLDRLRRCRELREWYEGM